MSPKRRDLPEDLPEELRSIYPSLEARGKPVRSRELEEIYNRLEDRPPRHEIRKFRKGLPIRPEIRRGETETSPFSPGGVPMTGVEPGQVTSKSLLRGNALDAALKKSKLQRKPMRYGAQGTVRTSRIQGRLANDSGAGQVDYDDWGRLRPSFSGPETRAIALSNPTRAEIEEFVIDVRNGCVLEGLAEPLSHDGPMKEVVLESGRRINLPDARLAIVQSLARRRLAHIVDRKLPPTTFAYRPQTSRQTALYAAQRLVSTDGFAHCTCADVRQCFPSITVAHIEEAFAVRYPEVHSSMRRLLTYSANVDRLVPVLDGENAGVRYNHQPSAGHLLQGAPIAPMLANVVLAHYADLPSLQRGNPDVVLLRWADDLLFLAKTPEESARALHEVELRLNAAGFSFKEAKCMRDPVDLRTGSIGWLGYELSEAGVRLSADKVQQKLDRVVEAATLRQAHCVLCSTYADMTLESAEAVEAFLGEIRERRPQAWRRFKKRKRKNATKRRHRHVRFYRRYQQVAAAIRGSGQAGIGAKPEEGT